MDGDTQVLTLLDLGSGPGNLLQKEYPDAKIVRVDLDPETEPDLLCDLRNLTMEDNSVDGAASMHTLEHMPWPEVPIALAEWYRVIRPGGLLHVSVPDLGWIAAEIMSNRMTIGIIAGIFGAQDSEFQAHRSGFTLPSLIGQVGQAGFDVLEAERRPFYIMTRSHPTVAIREIIQEIYVIARKDGG